MYVFFISVLESIRAHSNESFGRYEPRTYIKHAGKEFIYLYIGLSLCLCISIYIRVLAFQNPLLNKGLSQICATSFKHDLHQREE